MELDDNGRIGAEELRRSEAGRDEVVLDAFIVTPHHLHAVLCIVPPEVDGMSPRGYDLDVGRDPTSPRNVSNNNVGRMALRP